MRVMGHSRLLWQARGDFEVGGLFRGQGVVHGALEFMEEVQVVRQLVDHTTFITPASTQDARLQIWGSVGQLLHHMAPILHGT